MLNDAKEFKHVYIAVGYTDLRRGIDSLTMIIRNNFKHNTTLKWNYITLKRNMKRVINWKKERIIAYTYLFSLIWESLIFSGHHMSMRHNLNFILIILLFCSLSALLYLSLRWIKEKLFYLETIGKILEVFSKTVYFSCIECFPIFIVFAMGRWMTLSFCCGIWLPILIFKIIILILLKKAII